MTSPQRSMTTRKRKKSQATLRSDMDKHRDQVRQQLQAQEEEMDIKLRAVKEKVISDLQEISQALHNKAENQEENKEKKTQVEREAQTVPTTSKEIPEQTNRNVIRTQRPLTITNQPTANHITPKITPHQ